MLLKAPGENTALEFLPPDESTFRPLEQTRSLQCPKHAACVTFTLLNKEKESWVGRTIIAQHTFRTH